MGLRDLRMPPGGCAPTIPRTQSPPYTPCQGLQPGRGRAGARPGPYDAPRLHPCPLAPGRVSPQPSLPTGKGPARPGAGLLAPVSPGPREGLAQQVPRKSLLMTSNRPSLPCSSGCTSARLRGARQAAICPGPLTLPNRARETGRSLRNSLLHGELGGMTTRRFN